jgi:hypothetical protein
VRPKRGKVELLGVLLAVVVGVGAGVVVDGRSGGDRAEVGDDLRDVEVAEAPATANEVDLAELAGQIEVVETGFTAGQREICPGSSDPDPSDGCYGCSVARGCGPFSSAIVHPLSYGVVLRYDGDLLLKAVSVTIQLLDAAGQPAGGPEGHTFELSRLLPGEEVGLGDTIELDRGGVAEIRVEIGAPSEAMTVEYAKAAADVVAVMDLVAADDPSSGWTSPYPGAWEVSFGFEASVPSDVSTSAVGRHSVSGSVPDPAEDLRIVSGWAHAIFRDGGGRIVGGASDLVTLDLENPSGSMTVPHQGLLPDIAAEQTAFFLTEVAPA